MADEENSTESPQDANAPLTAADGASRAAARKASARRFLRRSGSAGIPAKTVTASTPVARKSTRGTRGAVRSVVTIAAVTGLVATVAIPAYAAWQPETETTTLQQLAEDGAQTLVVASEVEDAGFTRDSYSATTPEEIEKKKAEEAAVARAKAVAASAAATASSGGSTVVEPAAIPSGSGALGWPLTNISSISDRFGARGGTHNGLDMLAPAMSPIYASADGVVSVSTEGGGGYGVHVKIEHVIDGQRVSTLYAHMSYGTRAVQAGQTVKKGQVIGGVGSTGFSSANHVHFEVFVNNMKVNPEGWLG
ncbi:M23 family metallopeptidase [Microbacterium sp. LRZ72]|uniref:M23 family metallopeptidase n=1 Tax=Microbacterium sp. LRZ72 TaxID=2942481 RepID=UPI0029A43084|nr:M23 family metallopeptidase [Microbacterium sp. LRZ72]MDX2375924.1 M23 family metallopeptidase [Microbacterium sp. LRZ72]